MTPYQLTLCAKAFRDREAESRDTDMWQAWHIGAFGRIDRLPPLDEVLTKSGVRPAGKGPVGSAPQDKLGKDLMAALMTRPSVVATRPKETAADPSKT